MKRNQQNSLSGLIVISIIILSVVVFSFGCVKKDEAREIKIGLVTALTGPVAPYGENVRDGCLLAVEEINQQEDINIKLIIEDENNSSRDAVNAVQKLIVVDNVPAIIGPIISSGFLAAAPIANQNKVVLFSPTGMADNIREAGDYIFRNRVSASQEAGVLAEYVMNEVGLKKLAILRTDSDYGQSFSNVCRTIVSEQTGEVVIEETFEQGATDFRTQLTKIKALNSEGLFIIGLPVEIGNMLRQIREIKLDARLFSNSIESPKIFEIADGAEEGLIFSTTFYDPEHGDVKAKEFDDKFNDRFGRPSHFFAANAYDAVYVLSNVIREYGYNGEDIKQGLYAMKKYNGASGIIEFDDKGDLKHFKVAIKKISDGQFQFVKEIKR